MDQDPEIEAEPDFDVSVNGYVKAGRLFHRLNDLRLEPVEIERQQDKVSGQDQGGECYNAYR
jgi:hypothetical protein